MDYDTSDYLMISGIQHFEFCPRQWALIHIEQQWDENTRTVQGNIVHKTVDQPLIKEKRGDKVVSRAMSVLSHELKITGVCDVVEFNRDEKGIEISRLNGNYKVTPVEYKRGRTKDHNADVYQLVAQVLCLEEMLVCNIEFGFLFYDETKRREKVIITDQLREEVKATFIEMQHLYTRRHTPKVKTGNWCRNCSLKDICLPVLMNKESVNKYINRRLDE